MSFGKNLQYLRQLSAGMTQEALAERLNVSRQTISKWEMDAANPEMDKALELCKVFNCTLDNLFRDEMDQHSSAYSNLRVEKVPGFRYVEHTVISTEPEADALDRVFKYAKDRGDEHPKVIGWDFPRLSMEQINVFRMHGYTAAWILPEGMKPEGLEVKEQAEHRYAAIHIDRPFDNPFSTILGAYHTLGDYMRTNGLVQVKDEVIPCFETDGERKCACPANRSHRAGYPFTSKPASCSHRRRALVHIDSRERVGCSTRSHRELHPVGTEKCTLSGGRGQKEKALISQDFFGLVVATGLEPVTPSM